MSDPREPWWGRLGLGLFVWGVFVGPYWAITAAGMMQLFPELVGGTTEIRDDGQMVQVFSAWSWLLAGAWSTAAALVLTAVVGLLGGFSYLSGLVSASLARGQSQRFAQVAGDAIMPGVTLRTTTHDAPPGSGDPPAGQ